jgi:competence protein ComEC
LWDTDNNKNIDWTKNGSGKYRKEDWQFYLSLRNGTNTNLTRLTLHSGAVGKYWNVADDGKQGGDGLHVLAPTAELIKNDNLKCADYHGCSYVLLYMTGKHKILFGGDSHDDTWDHILANHKEDVTNVDVLIAPHHGRSSDRSYKSSPHWSCCTESIT